MSGRLAWLLLGTALFWLALSYPVWRLWGEAALWQSLAALGLCLVPGAVTLLWGRWAAAQPAEMQLLMLVGSTGLRMVFVLAGGLVLFFRVPLFHEASFWTWILVFYLFTLALEMTLLLVKAAPAKDAPG